MHFQACQSSNLLFLCVVASDLSALPHTSTLVTNTSLTVPSEYGEKYKSQVTRFSPAFCYVLRLGSIYPLLYKILKYQQVIFIVAPCILTIHKLSKTDKCTNMSCIILKHTLKHLKGSYMFRSMIIIREHM
jgi:hypothetical protein